MEPTKRYHLLDWRDYPTDDLPENVTDRQAARIISIYNMVIEGLKKQNLEASERGFSSRYELKEFKVVKTDENANIVIEAGMIADEGTMASILCRARIHIFIRKGGGLEMFGKKDGKVKGGKVMRRLRLLIEDNIGTN